ncbi:MAG: hypothetical protein HFG46_05465 [Clostridium sp.]|nr:hypothetical protein [Clostridium sp.]
MSDTALGAEKAIIFISDAHEKLKEVRYQDVYHKAHDKRKLFNEVDISLR